MTQNQPNASLESSNKREHIQNAEIGNGKPYAFDENDVGITRFGSISKELIGEESVPGYHEIESIGKPNASMEGLREEFITRILTTSDFLIREGYPGRMEGIDLVKMCDFWISNMASLLNEAEERFRKALDDNENEILWGDKESNEVMRVCSIKEYKEAVLQSLTKPSK